MTELLHRAALKNTATGSWGSWQSSLPSEQNDPKDSDPEGAHGASPHDEVQTGFGKGATFSRYENTSMATVVIEN